MKKRYAVCGVSSRALAMYIRPMVKNFAHVAEFVGMLDIDPLRFQICKEGRHYILAISAISYNLWIRIVNGAFRLYVLLTRRK